MIDPAILLPYILACLLFAIVAGGTVGYIAGNLAIVFAVPSVISRIDADQDERANTPDTILPS